MSEKTTRFNRTAKPTRNWIFSAQSPTEVGERARAVEEMQRGNVHQNNLIALERRRRELVAGLMREHYPEIECWEALVAALKDEKEELFAAARRRGQREGNRAKLTPEEKIHDAILRQQIRDAASILGRAKGKEYPGSGLRGTASNDEALQRAIVAVNEVSHASALRLRATCGCYSGTYQLAEERASASLKTANPRNVRVGGDGCFGVQIGDGGLPVSRVFATQEGIGLAPELQIHQAQHCKARDVVELWIRTGSRDKNGVERKYGREPIWVRLQVKLHRETSPDGEPLPFNVDTRRKGTARTRGLPHDAVIQRCVVHRKLTGYQEEWSVRFVLSRASWVKEGRATSGACGVNLNWRQFPDGSLRVATAIGDDGEKHELFISAQDVSGWPLIDHLKSIRDRHFDWMRCRLADWLDANRGILPDWLIERCEHLRSWKSPYRLMRLVEFWCDNRFDGDDTIWPYNYYLKAKQIHHQAHRSFRGQEPMPDWFSGKHPYPNLQDWAKIDKILCERQINIAKRNAKSRKHLYENFANLLGRRYRTVILGKVDYRKLARNPTPADQDGKVAAAKYNSRIAASGALHQTLKAFAANPVEVSPENITQRCWHCGEIDPDFDAARHLIHVCSLCGGEIDQDDSAARWLLQWPRESRGGETGDGPSDDDSPDASAELERVCAGDDGQITANGRSRNGSHDGNGVCADESSGEQRNGDTKQGSLARSALESNSERS